MYGANDPKWLRFLSRHMAWLAIPNIASFFVGLQVIGFIFIYTNHAWMGRLALIPGFVWHGEFWRVITFLAVPISTSIIWLAVALWFEYFVLNAVESEWGAFKTTFYALISVALTVAFSLVFGYPVLRPTGLTSTFFLAAAALFPDYEIQLYFFIPVKMKYLGWLTLAFILIRLVQDNWMDRFLLLTIYSNYLLFFGPSLWARAKQFKRRRDFRSKWR